MACPDFEELILRDLDGETESPDRARLTDHLTGCSTCAADRDLFGRLDEAIRHSSCPAAPRRDFAATALERTTVASVGFPRRILSQTTWTLFGGGSVVALLGILLGLIWLGTRSSPGPAEVDPTRVPSRESHLSVETAIAPEVVLPVSRYLEPDELRKIFPFDESDPVRELVYVNLELAETDTPSGRFRLLTRGLEGLLDGFASACAYGDMGGAQEYREAIGILMQEGVVQLLARIHQRVLLPELESWGQTVERHYAALMAFARELPRARRSEVERVLAFCSEGREAARNTARRLEVP